MYPTQVELNEENIARLTKLFKGAYAEIVREIETATDWGVQNRKQLLAQVKGILTELGVDTQEFLEKELPEYYKMGADSAVAQLKNIGADVGVSEGFNRVHKEAIAALVDDTSRAFGESMTGVARSANLLMGRATRETLTQKLGEGIIGGKALKEVQSTIKTTLREQGLSALVDKGGHKWELDRYAEMLFRTKAVEARNRGLINRMVENDYDLVQVSSHPGSCDACAYWQGTVLSARGGTPGYKTVADAEADGLFHPNCRHAINVLIPSLARMTDAYDPDVPTKVITKEPKKAVFVHHNKTTGQDKNIEFNLTPTEAAWAKEKGLAYEVNNSMSANARHVYDTVNGKSTYKIEFNYYSMVNIENADKVMERSFFHEFGHFIDRSKVVEAKKSLSYYKPEVTSALVVEKKNIVIDRIKFMKPGLSDEDYANIYRGLSWEEDGRKLHFTKTYTNYLKKNSEVFADGYGQYKMNPEEFKKRAPLLYDIYSKLMP